MNGAYRMITGLVPHGGTVLDLGCGCGEVALNAAMAAGVILYEARRQRALRE